MRGKYSPRLCPIQSNSFRPDTNRQKYKTNSAHKSHPWGGKNFRPPLGEKIYLSTVWAEMWQFLQIFFFFGRKNLIFGACVTKKYFYCGARLDAGRSASGGVSGTYLNVLTHMFCVVLHNKCVVLIFKISSCTFNYNVVKNPFPTNFLSKKSKHLEFVLQFFGNVYDFHELK